MLTTLEKQQNIASNKFTKKDKSLEAQVFGVPPIGFEWHKKIKMILCHSLRERTLGARRRLYADVEV